MDKTYVVKGIPESNWLLVDAADQNLGRLATQIAAYLLGKHKPTFTPGVAVGDHVVVVNAAKLGLSEKRLDTKNYYKHSGYPGGLKTVGLREQIATHPDRVIRAAVWGMLPHNKLGRQLIKRLKVYGGAEHPHTAQTPEPVAK
ncbi:MAG TPA: 50S ribosomal protein L13 [Bellilinea sp.]|uniref:Large ribosomal subunit protein uL13 n=2 Tax=environmental samples TaxID=58229 RepID=A0A0H4T9J0_9CHLR|nr:50S ribosomal protein L13, large subunit ribosomal protein L13 [uncultured Chloroflexi bacterium Rifle_16ft_4_minimus_640]